MKIYYVSHPYGGKQENEAKADEMDILSVDFMRY